MKDLFHLTQMAVILSLVSHKLMAWILGIEELSVGIPIVGHMFVQVPGVPFRVHVLFYSGSLITDRV